MLEAEIYLRARIRTLTIIIDLIYGIIMLIPFKLVVQEHN